MPSAVEPARASSGTQSVTARYVDLLVGLVNAVCPTWAGGRRVESSTRGATEWARTRLAPDVAADLRRDVRGGGLDRLARELHELFTASTPAESIDRLNKSLATRPVRAHLVDDVGLPYHLHVSAAAGSAVDDLAAELLITLARVVDRFGEPRTRTCAAPRCELVFVDTTKNGGRRYCSDRCAARTKMAAARALARLEEHPSDD